MTIFFTIDDISGRGGTERVVANLANAFAPTHNIVIISYHLRFENISVNLPKNTKIINFDEIHSGFEPKGTLGKLKLCYYINQIIRANGSDKNALIANCNVFYPFFKRRNTLYTRLEHYNFRFLHGKYVDKKPFMSRIALFDALIVLSSSELLLWQKLNNNVRVIPNFLPQIPQKSTDYVQKVVLSVGRMDNGDQKGFLRLLDIWKMVQEMIHNPSLQENATHHTLSLRANKMSVEVHKKEFCHIEALAEVSPNLNDRDISLSTKAQYDKDIDCHEFDKSNSRNDTKPCHTECSEVSKNNNVDLVDSSLHCVPLRMTDKRVNSTHKKSKETLSQWRLVIVGDGILKDEIESKIKALNLQDSIILKPFTKEIEKEYLSASIYAMSSHFEGFPMVLLESTSYGLAPISFDIKTGPSDIIAHNQSGFLVRDDDLQDYADKLITLMSDESLRANFGTKAKELVSERFSKEVVMKLWEKVFDEMKR